MIDSSCSVDGCDKKVVGLGFCAMHYRRNKIYGSPTIVTRLYGLGKTKHQLISVYKDMLRRCNNQNDKAFKNYGGRGIKVCNRWIGKDGFKNFLDDMGPRPDGRLPSGKPLYTLDRIDVNGDYCPENCRWATWKEQGANLRKNRFVYLWGERYTLSQACAILGLKSSNIISLMGSKNKKVKRDIDEALIQGLINCYNERIKI